MLLQESPLQSCFWAGELAPDIAARVRKNQAQSTYSGVNRNFEGEDSVWAKAYGKVQLGGRFGNQEARKSRL